MSACVATSAISNVAKNVRFPFFTSSLPAEILVNSFDELVRRPRAGVAAVSTAGSLDRVSLANLIERHPLADPRTNAIADDRDHVAIVDDIRLVTDEAVPRNHDGSPFLPDERDRRDGDADDAVQTIDDTLNAS